MDAELAKKGLTRADSNNANLYIAYQAALQQEKEYTSYNSSWGYGPGGREYGGQAAKLFFGILSVKSSQGREFLPFSVVCHHQVLTDQNFPDYPAQRIQ